MSAAASAARLSTWPNGSRAGRRRRYRGARYPVRTGELAGEFARWPIASRSPNSRPRRSRRREFDLIVSRDSFEHYGDPEGILAAMLRRLAPAGNSPSVWPALEIALRRPHHLYDAPAVGAPALPRARHPGRAPSLLPRPTGQRVRRDCRRPEPDDPRPVQCPDRATPFRTVSCRTNVSDHPLGRLFTLAGRLPLAREYATFNLYGIWRLPEGHR